LGLGKEGKEGEEGEEGEEGNRIRGKGEAFGQIIYGFDSKIFRPNASPLLS
jgi:hypothetical protein